MHPEEHSFASHAPAPDVERWLLPVRHFIGTDDTRFLARAIEACDHPGTQAFLREIERSDEQEGRVPEHKAEMTRALVEQWSARRETAAVAAVAMLSHRVSLRLATRNVHVLGANRDLLDEAVNRFLGESLELAHNAGFAECEAAFTLLASEWFVRVEDWDPAGGAATRAVRQYSEVFAALAKAQDEAALAYLRRNAEVAIHATKVMGHLGDEARAFEAFNMARYSIDSLERRGSLDRPLALAVQQAFHLMSRLRDFRIAWELGAMALSAVRNLHAREPGPQSAYDLAVMENEFARLHVQQGRYEEGETLLREAIDLVEAHFEGTTWWPALVMLGGSYSGLAHSRRLRGENEDLLVLYARAMDFLRRAAYQGKDPTYTSHAFLVTALANLGSAHIDAGNFHIADRAFDEAEEVRQQIRARAPYVPIQNEWQIDGARSYLLLLAGREAEALELGERALRLVEARDVPAHERWMTKGPAEQLYAQMFDLYARAGDLVNASVAFALCAPAPSLRTTTRGRTSTPSSLPCGRRRVAPAGGSSSCARRTSRTHACGWGYWTAAKASARWTAPRSYARPG